MAKRGKHWKTICVGSRDALSLLSSVTQCASSFLNTKLVHKIDCLSQLYGMVGPEVIQIFNVSKLSLDKHYTVGNNYINFLRYVQKEFAIFERKGMFLTLLLLNTAQPQPFKPI